MKSELSIDLILAIIADLKESTGVVPNPSRIKSELQNRAIRYSNSTVGPLIAEALFLTEQKRIFAPESISPRCFAGFMHEQKRIRDEFTKWFEQKTLTDAEENATLLDKIDQLSKALHDKKDELSDTQKKLLEAQRDLAGAEGRISTFDEQKAGLTKEVQEARQKISELTEIIAALKSELQCANRDRTAAISERNSLATDCEEAKDRGRTTERERDLAKQEAENLRATVADLKAEKSALSERILRVEKDYKCIQEKLSAAIEGRADVAARLDERSKKSSANRRSGAKAKATPEQPARTDSTKQN